MGTVATVTVRQLRHDLKSVEKALAKGPVKVTKRGKIVWTIRVEKAATKPALSAKKWDSAAHAARMRRVLGAKADVPVDVLDFLG
jgi:uncharacterized protein YicC (UPF0701 family)